MQPQLHAHISLVSGSLCFSTARKGTTLEVSFMATRKIGRDAGSGKFVPVKEAQKNKGGAVVETIKVPPPKPSPKPKK